MWFLSSGSLNSLYQYNVASRLTKLTYPDDMEILYSYDDFNRTTEIKRYVDGSNDEILMDNIQYDTESLLTQFDYGNNLQATFSYDERDRLSPIDVKDGITSLYEENTTGTATYIHGPAGILAKRTTINEETKTFYYHTDHLGSTRLVTDDSKNTVAAVTYHPFGESSAEGNSSLLYTSTPESTFETKCQENVRVLIKNGTLKRNFSTSNHYHLFSERL